MAGGPVQSGVQTPSRRDRGRTARANEPVTEIKGGGTSAPMGIIGQGKQAEATMGMGSPSAGPGGGHVTSEGRLQ